MVSAVGASRSRHVRGRRGQEGQALVEFALIIPLFLMIVVGMIQFGLALNYWLDMQRIANQGARWAAVDRYPIRTDLNPPDPAAPTCNAEWVATNGPCQTSLQDTLRFEKLSKGEQIDPYICFPSKTGPPAIPGGPNTPTVGDPVTVRMSRNFNFLQIVTAFTGSGLNIELRGSATMRLEQVPTTFTEDGPCT
jgi:Flp pilus assembly protein TadG